MLVAKKDPKGVDLTINAIQTFMYDHLTKDCNWVKYESYHRAYKNPSKNNVIPEIYTRKGEYKEVLYNDKFSATSYFLIDDDAVHNPTTGLFTQGISLIVQADLNALYGEVIHRADEEARNDVTFGFKQMEQEIHHKMNRVSTGVKNVYRDLRLAGTFEERVKLDDISFSHVFRVDFFIEYYYDTCGYNLM